MIKVSKPIVEGASMDSHLDDDVVPMAAAPLTVTAMVLGAPHTEQHADKLLKGMMPSPKTIGSVIDPVRHQKLLADIDAVLARGHISKAALFQSATEVCAPGELEWLKEYRKNAEQVRGLVLTGVPKAGAGPEKKFMAMAACLIRNFVDAQVLSLGTVVDSLESDAPDCTVLLIPNLYVRQGAKTIPSWQMQKVSDLLLSRLVSSQITCCYVDSMEHLGTEYGQNIVSHLRDNNLILPA